MRITPGATRVIITAVRGSTVDSDIGVDDLSLSTTDCDGRFLLLVHVVSLMLPK